MMSQGQEDPTKQLLVSTQTVTNASVYQNSEDASSLAPDELDSLQSQDDDQFESIFNHLVKRKRDQTHPKFDHCRGRLDYQSVNLGLVTELDIFSEQRLKVIECWKVLSLYVYQHPNTSSQQSLSEKVLYYTSFLLMDVFAKYTSSKDNSNRFYVITKDTVVVIGYCKNDRFALTLSDNDQLSKSLQLEQIQSHNMTVGEVKSYACLIRYCAMRQFWNYYLNELVRRRTAFEVVSNFNFTCSTEFVPREVYNGKTQDSGGNKNFHLKLQGLFLRQNVQNLYNLNVKANKLDIKCNTYKNTDQIQAILEMSFSQASKSSFYSVKGYKKQERQQLREVIHEDQDQEHSFES